MPYLPSIEVAPTSSKSLLASNFKSEPTETHLYKINAERRKALNKDYLKSIIPASLA